MPPVRQCGHKASPKNSGGHVLSLTFTFYGKDKATFQFTEKTMGTK